MFTSLQTICDHTMRLQVLDVLNNLFIYINILVNIHKPYTYSGFWHACLWAKLKKACTTSYPYLPSSNTGFSRNICIVYSKNRFVEKSNNFENFTFVHTEGETMRNTRSSGADLDLNECRSLVLILIWSIFWKYYFSNSFCHHFI